MTGLVPQTARGDFCTVGDLVDNIDAAVKLVGEDWGFSRQVAAFRCGIQHVKLRFTDQNTVEAQYTWTQAPKP